MACGVDWSSQRPTTTTKTLDGEVERCVPQQVQQAEGALSPIGGVVNLDTADLEPFLDEVLEQGRFALYAYKRMYEAGEELAKERRARLAPFPDFDPIDDHEGWGRQIIAFGKSHERAVRETHWETRVVFFYAHAFLTHTANVAKLLDPPDAVPMPRQVASTLTKEQRRLRFEEIRSRLNERGMELRRLLGVEDGSVLLSRDMRNHIEHYDERLQSWHAASDFKWRLDLVIWNNEGPEMIPPTDRHRVLDPDLRTYRFQDSALDLAKVAEELFAVLERAEANRSSEG